MVTMTQLLNLSDHIAELMLYGWSLVLMLGCVLVAVLAAGRRS